MHVGQRMPIKVSHRPPDMTDHMAFDDMMLLIISQKRMPLLIIICNEGDNSDDAPNWAKTDME